MPTKRQTPNKVLVILGITFFLAWPFLFFSSGWFINIIPPHEAPRMIGYSTKESIILLSLLLGPPILGALFILFGVMKNPGIHRGSSRPHKPGR